MPLTMARELTAPDREILRAALQQLRVIDPACGSGARFWSIFSNASLISHAQPAMTGPVGDVRRDVLATLDFRRGHQPDGRLAL